MPLFCQLSAGSHKARLTGEKLVPPEPSTAERAMGAKKRRYKGSARVGTPKTAGPGGRCWFAHFWGALARRTAGATLLPLRALPHRSMMRTRNPITATPGLSIAQLLGTAARDREGFCRFPTCSSAGVRTGLWANRRSRGGLCPVQRTVSPGVTQPGEQRPGPEKVAGGTP
jgi:hypothetical protein